MRRRKWLAERQMALHTIQTIDPSLAQKALDALLAQSEILLNDFGISGAIGAKGVVISLSWRSDHRGSIEIEALLPAL
jgi:hypothetical protein